MERRQVVVTGLGCVTPLGVGVEHVWKRLLAGESGAVALSDEAYEKLPTRIACKVPRGEAEHEYEASRSLGHKEARRFSDYIGFGVEAARQAIEDAGWQPEALEDLERTGVLMGSGIGGFNTICDTTLMAQEKGNRRISPFFVPSILTNIPSGLIAQTYGFQGPNHCVATACATGAHALGDAMWMIARGDADVMVVGSTESAVGPMTIAGFGAARALSRGFNDDPQKASRPWDRDRDGFVVGEGAGALILEERGHAEARGAHIYGEICGYGMSGDAYHLTAPAEDGRGARRAMQAAFRSAAMEPEQVSYVNAHGTSTPLGDSVEASAIGSVFGDHRNHLKVSSTKSAIGHLLGGAGSVEAVFSLLAIRDQRLPPTLNLDNPSEDWGLDFVAHESQTCEVNAVMSNSFGFGGTNASLIFKKTD